VVYRGSAIGGGARGLGAPPGPRVAARRPPEGPLLWGTLPLLPAACGRGEGRALGNADLAAGPSSPWALALPPLLLLLLLARVVLLLAVRGAACPRGR